MNSLAIQSLPTAARDAARIAHRMGIPVHYIESYQFPDGELRVTVGQAAQTNIIYAPLDRPNDKLLAVLFAAEALRRNGGARLVLLAPYLCYMRQDTAFKACEAISQKVIGQLLAQTVDRVITVDAHLHRTPDIGSVFPGIAAENLSATPAIADALRKDAVDPRTVVVGPDAESLTWVRDLAGRLGLAHAVSRKIRLGDRAVEIELGAKVSGRPILLVDDIVSSGGTLIGCAQALAAAGAKTIDAVITHALFPPEMIGDFARAGIRSVRSTYSVPHPTNAVILDDLFVAALENEMNNSAFSESAS